MDDRTGERNGCVGRACVVRPVCDAAAARSPTRCETRAQSHPSGGCLPHHTPMNWRRVGWTALFLFALAKAWGQWEHRAIHPADGALAPDAPRQADADGAPTIELGRWTLTPRASYDITARILGREDYRFDPIADLAPLDLALGWGPMSDNQVLQGLEISQGARFYSWRPVTGSQPLDVRELSTHSANTHVIPANAAVAARLAALRHGGQVVQLTGLLVDGARDDGMTIRTSLTRTDTGAGACEFMLVQSVQVR